MEQYVKYLRKSRFDRDYAELTEEETLRRHEKLLDDLARQRGYHVVKTYQEVVSGDSIAARPEVQKLLEEVSAGLYAGVLVVDVERLARGNSADQAYISQVFQFSGTKIITPAKTYDPSDEFDEEYFEFGLFMSRREYKTITRRLVRGRESSAAEGKWVSSIAPYGYRRVKLDQEKGYTLEPDPEEAEVLRDIFAQYLAGQGTKRIANRLNDRRIPTRRGGPWTCSTISNILSNPAYCGKVRRGGFRTSRTITDGQVRTHRINPAAYDDGRLYDGLHPPLISQEDFLQAQDIVRRRSPAPKVRKAYALQNAFAGLIYCAVCGRRIGRSTTGKPSGTLVRLRCVNARSCHNVSADYYAVEREIIRSLSEWLAGYRVKLDTGDFSEELADRCRRLEELSRDRARLELRLENAYALVEQGVYTADVFTARRDKLTDELDALAGAEQALEAELRALQSVSEAQMALIPRTETLLESYYDMDASERNALLKGILHRIEYRKEADGQITIDLFPKLPRHEAPVGTMDGPAHG